MTGVPTRAFPGLSLAAFVAALIAGAPAAKGLHDAWPLAAWATTAGLAAALYAAMRILSRSVPGALRGVLFLGLVGFTLMFMLVLGGESMPRPGRRDAIGALTLLATILAVIAVTVLATAAIVIAGLRTGLGMAA